MPFKNVFFTLLSLLVVSGCASFRGMPSHGGGKRFDEEERLVAAAIYTALDQMALTELVGKKVRIENQSITTYGGGNVTFGGLKDIGLSVGNTIYDNSTAGRSQTDSFSGNIRYSPDLNFYSSLANTDQDTKYFIAGLEMKLRHTNITPVPNGEEITLFVLLDVLGTNLGRKDQLINRTDNLSASCEFTYYAVEAKTGKLLFESRRCGGMALYTEKSTLFTGKSVIERKVEPKTLLDMPNFHTAHTETPVEEKTIAAEVQTPSLSEPPATEEESTSKKRPYWQYSIGFLQNLLTFHKATPATEPVKEQPVPASEKLVANGTDADSQIKTLETQAIQLIQSGNRNQAAEVIQQIRAIDPSADALKEIAVMQAGQ